MTYELWTDGSSTGKVAEGGWAWILTKDGIIIKQDSQGCSFTTNNLMEMSGAIHGLWYCYQEKLCPTWYSDSQYTLNIASGVFTPKKNLESAKLLRKLWEAVKPPSKWIKGHTGLYPFHTECDRMSKAAKDEWKPK